MIYILLRQDPEASLMVNEDDMPTGGYYPQGGKNIYAYILIHVLLVQVKIYFTVETTIFYQFHDTIM